MKIISLNEITKSIITMGSTNSLGIYSLYGRGSGISASITSESYTGEPLTSLFGPPTRDDYILEFDNLTIGEGVDILATDISPVFFLKVNGTLMVNGHLHMDGKGGSFVGTTGTLSTETDPSTGDPIYVYKNNTSLNYFDTYNLPVITSNTSCSNSLWYNLTNYGVQETFFTGKVALTGGGGVGYTNYEYTTTTKVEKEPKINPYQDKYGYYYFGQWKWTHYDQYLADVEANSIITETKYYEPRGSQSLATLSGGGNYYMVDKPQDGNYSCGGGGGGFLALYSETFINSGNMFTENGNKYPLNIHANGGNEFNVTSTPVNGGGMMVIAARHIVIGPNGSITCDGGNGNGIMTLLGRNPLSKVYLYNNGTPMEYNDTFSGGGGFAQHFLK